MYTRALGGPLLCAVAITYAPGRAFICYLCCGAPTSTDEESNRSRFVVVRAPEQTIGGSEVRCSSVYVLLAVFL
jgi:hypothetical protein